MLGAPNPGANFAGWSVPTNMPGQPSGSGGSNTYMPLINPSGANTNPYSFAGSGYAPPNSGTPQAAAAGGSGFPANNNGYGTSNLIPSGSSSVGSSLGFGTGPVTGTNNPFHNTFTT